MKRLGSLLAIGAVLVVAARPSTLPPSFNIPAMSRAELLTVSA